jgi:Protein of unknown function (DUF3363)
MKPKAETTAASAHQRNLLSRLQQQEIGRVGREMAKARGLTFEPTEIGSYVSGTLIGTANFASGRYAMIDDGLEFSLVPWRPVLEHQLGRHITGIGLPMENRLEVRSKPGSRPLVRQESQTQRRGLVFLQTKVIVLFIGRS